MLEKFTFAHPAYLYILLGLVPYIGWYVWRHKFQKASLTYSEVGSLSNLPKTAMHYLQHLPFILKVLAIGCLVLALARPQSFKAWQDTTTEGIDIVIAMDISTSMLAQDFTPNRLEASKNVAVRFISGRQTDRIGLVIFAGESFTQCPVTTDHAVLINYFKDIRTGIIEDGTAMGLGLANAVNRLKESDAKSKVIILLTDGVNNSGQIAPLMAADIAQTYGIRVYTVGVGTNGTAPYPMQTMNGQTVIQQTKVEIDEQTLEKIAEKTDGKYFRAQDNKMLAEVYKKIDKLEKTKIEQRKHKETKDNYFFFAVACLVLLSLSVLLEITLFKSVF